MIRHHSAADVPGLFVSDVNFSFSCFVHNDGFCFLQVGWPTVFASPSPCVPLTFGLQDALSYQVLKKTGCFVLSGAKKMYNTDSLNAIFRNT